MRKVKKETKAEKVAELDNVIIFKANRPMDEGEHKQLSEKIRFEEEKSGLKIVLMPYTCDVVDQKQEQKPISEELPKTDDSNNSEADKQVDIAGNDPESSNQNENSNSDGGENNDQ